MNKRAFIAILLLIGVAVAIASLMPEGIQPVKIGDQVKTFVLPDLKGKAQSLPEGKVILLNFWATWCPPCRKEVPSMVKLYDKFKDKGFEIVAVSVDRNIEDITEFVTEQNMNFTVLHDKDSKVSHQYGVFRYPESLIVDSNGVVLQHLNGAVEWMEPQFHDYIEKLLNAPVVELTKSES